MKTLNNYEREYIEDALEECRFYLDKNEIPYYPSFTLKYDAFDKLLNRFRVIIRHHCIGGEVEVKLIFAVTASHIAVSNFTLISITHKFYRDE